MYGLIQPTKIVYEPIDKAITVYDEKTKSPIRTARRGSLTLKAQVVWDVTQDRLAWTGTDRENAGGYVVVSKKQINEFNLTPKVGDKISKIGDVDASLYVVRTMAFGHMGGKARYLKLYLEDRSPVA